MDHSEGSYDEVYKNIANHVVLKKVLKGTVLQKKGEPVLKAYKVKTGLLRSYTVDEKGKEHIYMFAPEGWLVLDVELFSLDSKAELYIDALEDSELEVFWDGGF